jgi:hypothetical protein
MVKLTLESELNFSISFLSDENKFGFFHFGCFKIGHWGRIFVLFVFVLPVFDQLFNLFLSRLNVIEILGSLINTFDLNDKMVTYIFFASPSN